MELPSRAHFAAGLPAKISNLPCTVLFILILLPFCSNAGPFEFRRLFFSLIWAGMSCAIAAFVRANGRVFCNRPRLHRPCC